MTKEEVIWYLTPIAESASLDRYKEALSFALAALREQEERRWIPVTERLPKPNKLVLCLWESGDGEREHYGFATFQSHGVWYVSNEGMPKVTHWMPLPEPPKEEKK